jgi:hypothetical protein
MLLAEMPVAVIVIPGGSGWGLSITVPEKPLMLISVKLTVAMPLALRTGVAGFGMAMRFGVVIGRPVTMKLRSSISVVSGSIGGERVTGRIAEAPFRLVGRMMLEAPVEHVYVRLGGLRHDTCTNTWYTLKPGVALDTPTVVRLSTTWVTTL